MDVALQRGVYGLHWCTSLRTTTRPRLSDGFSRGDGVRPSSSKTKKDQSEL
jgi:hypothetical protein